MECSSMPGGGADTGDDDVSNSMYPSQDDTTTPDDSATDTDEEVSKHITVGIQSVLSQPLITQTKSVFDVSNNRIFASETRIPPEPNYDDGPRIAEKDATVLNQINLDPPELESNVSNNNDSEKKKPRPILGFNAYGNLTMLDEITPPEHIDPFDNIVPEDFMQDGVNNTIPKPVKKKSKPKVTATDLSPESGQQKLHNNGTMKKRTKSHESAYIDESYSDKELQQVFKNEFNTGATSRYGRARKKKTEDGFLFGTINFSELRRISGGSPKKNKNIDENSDNSEIKTEEESDSAPPPQEILEHKPEEESSHDEQTEVSDFVDEKPEPPKSNISPRPSPRKKKYQKKLSPKKKKPVDDDEDETWTVRQSSRIKSPKKPTTTSTSNLVKEESEKSTRRLRRLSQPKYTEEESSKETDAEEGILVNKLNNQSKTEDTKHINKLNNQSKTDDIKHTNKLNNQSKTDDTKHDSDYLTGDEKELKLQTTNDASRSLRKSKQKLDITKLKDDTAASPTTTKSGRQTKKFVPLDSLVEFEKEKEARRKRLEEKTQEPVVKTELLEKECPSTYLVGDIVWVMLRGNPIWPAIMTYHKTEELYTKLIFTQSKTNRLYHVQFCRDNQLTSWVNFHNITSFEGYQNFVEYLKTAKSQMNMKQMKVLKNESILKTINFMNKQQGNKYERWMGAIEEAETFYKLTRYERLQKLNEGEEDDDEEEYKVVKKSKTKEKKRRRSKKDLKIEEYESAIEENEVSEPVIKIENDCEDFSGFDETSTESQKSKRLKLMELTEHNFDVYVNEHRDALLQEDSTLTDDAIRNKLKSKWRKMTVTQKSRYRIANLKRKHSPSPDVETSSVDSVATSTSSGKRRRGRGGEGDDERGTYKVVRNERVCFICENVVGKNGLELVKCRGPCNGYFHYTCLGLNSLPSKEFKCDECLSNKHPCFICKSSETEAIRCSIPACGKFYHEACAKKWPQVNKLRQEKLVCPRHTCHMCAANADDMNNAAARTGPFTRCLRCPTTYHTGEDCIAAGSEEISQTHHICTKHLKTTKGSNFHFNVNWCFCCSKGGSLLLCDQCPAAFHADCMKITMPEGGYICEDCENGKFPVYGDVVWVKLGQYRWWPSQVLHPRHIPDNIENLNHQQGMFCVHFLGSNDYYWVTRGRAFHYQEGDQGAKAGFSTKTLEKRFAQALDEAAELYHTQKTLRDKCEAERTEKSNAKPPSFIKIDTNRPVGNVKLGKLDLASVNKCDCDPYSENPCSDDEKCINRMLSFECIREVCPAGDRCNNQRFQRRQYPSLTHAKTERRGWGLRALEDIKKGQFVIEYVGELVDEEEFRRRLNDMHEVKEENYYFLTIDSTLMIDAGPKGNLARFMNHSCQPNCETQKWTVGADTRVGLFAMEDIPSGSELTFNYNLECVGTEKKKCQCGAMNCSGFIGSKVKSEKKVPLKNDKLRNGKKKKKTRPKKNTEDECFRCGSAGDLILCDVSTCPKGYHLTCLGLDKLPKGKWFCPWHHCDVCGLKATSLCDYCPNSFCRNHATGNLQIINSVGNVCLEHGDDVEALRGQMEMTAVNLKTQEEMEIKQTLPTLDSAHAEEDISLTRGIYHKTPSPEPEVLKLIGSSKNTKKCNKVIEPGIIGNKIESNISQKSMSINSKPKQKENVEHLDFI